MQSHNLTEDISTPKNIDFIISWDYNSQLHKHYSERYSTEEVETMELITQVKRHSPGRYWFEGSLWHGKK